MLLAGLAPLSGSTALLAGSISGRRTYGLVTGAAVAVFGYVFNAVGRQSHHVEWLLQFSPYHWAFGDSPLASGASWCAAAGLWGTAATLVLLSALALQRRRDVGA